ncbi:MAG: ZIP family metal transporter [Methanomassiliicoccaceae archaeon]|jgi:zinc transporter 9|nr:ZIP family metal transporter [Methanomassiliicoccaceae archaeon]
MFQGTDPYVTLLIFTAAVLAVSLAGAYIPLLKKMSARQMHLMVALSAGIFLGILFFMLLPETFEGSDEAMDIIPWIAGGFLIVLAVDVILKWKHMATCPCEECDDREHGHQLTSASAFIGLAIHAAVDGIVLSIALGAGDDIAAVALVGIALHKFVELFALSSTFMLTGIEKKGALFYMIVFALITPAAALLSMPVIDIAEGMDAMVPLAIATGTFMYVGIYALLPEAFHERRDSIVSFVLVVAGMVIIALTSMLLGGHAH